MIPINEIGLIKVSPVHHGVKSDPWLQPTNMRRRHQFPHERDEMSVCGLQADYSAAG